MSFLYPRTVAIRRPQVSTSVGEQVGYAALQQTDEDVIAKGIAASIQAKGTSGRNPVGLPGDTPLVTWRILTPTSALQAGQVRDRDIIEDDLGNRYQVQSDYTNSLGCNFLCIRLEA